jgi:hypothetical protein
MKPKSMERCTWLKAKSVECALVYSRALVMSGVSGMATPANTRVGSGDMVGNEIIGWMPMRRIAKELDVGLDLKRVIWDFRLEVRQCRELSSRVWV